MFYPLIQKDPKNPWSTNDPQHLPNGTELLVCKITTETTRNIIIDRLYFPAIVHDGMVFVLDDVGGIYITTKSRKPTPKKYYEWEAFTYYADEWITRQMWRLYDPNNE